MTIEDAAGVPTPAPSGGDSDEPTSTFASLSDRRYRVLFVTGLLVFVAVQAQQIARGQIAYELTGSAKGLGGVFLGFGVATLLVTPFGGVAADRLPKRTVILCSIGCLVVSALWIGLADEFGFLEYWMLVGAAVVQGGGFAVYGPSRVAMTAELVPRRLVGNAIVLTQVSLNATKILAPAAAGTMIGIKTIGTSGVYLVTAVLTVIALLQSFRLPSIPVRTDRVHGSVTSEMADGVRYAWHHPRLRSLLAVSYVLILVGFPYVAFLPAVAEEVFGVGVSGYGLMSSVTAFGALGTTLWIAGRSRPSQAWRIQSLGAVGFSGGLVMLGLAPVFAVALLSLALAGGAAAAFQAMNNTLVLTESDLEYHGRVQSLLMVSFSGFGMAALPLGALADSIGLRPTYVMMGLVCLGASLLYLNVRRRYLQRQILFDV